MFAQSGIRSGIVFYDARVHITPDLYTHPTHNTPTLEGNGAQFFGAGTKTGAKTGAKTATAIGANATKATNAAKARIFDAYIVYNHKSQRYETQQTGNNLR